MPYPDESSCHLASTGSFDRIRRDNSKNPNVLIGFRKDGSSAVQSYRYPTSRWTVAAARAHCKRHGGSFEAATGSQETAEGLRQRCLELGLTEEQAGRAAQLFEILGEAFNSPVTVVENAVLAKKGEFIVNLGKEFNAFFEVGALLRGHFEDFKIFRSTNNDELIAAFDLQLTPAMRLPAGLPASGEATEEKALVVDLKMPDHEPHLEGVLEGLEAPDGAMACEKGLFQAEEAEFAYQAHITGLGEDKKIFVSTACHNKLRWKAKLDGETETVFGLTLAPGRMGDQDPLLSAMEREPVPISYIRPPQAAEWFTPDGFIEPGSPGTTKNRSACYLTEDRGTIRFGKQKPGYHEFMLKGERLSGRFLLEYVPGARGMEWILTRMPEEEVEEC